MAALSKAVNLGVAMSIVDVGLIYGVTVDAQKVHVLITMISAACPVADVIIGEVEQELDRIAPLEFLVYVDLVSNPPWTIDRMSGRARRFMGW